jgi:hypothetical protein
MGAIGSSGDRGIERVKGEKVSQGRIDNGLKRFDVPGAIDALGESTAKYGAMFPKYPDPDPVVAALRRARDNGKIQPGTPGKFLHGNPMTTVNGVIYIDPRVHLDRAQTGMYLSHEGQHLADPDFSSRFWRERRAFDVQHGFGRALGLPVQRKTDDAIHQDYGF